LINIYDTSKRLEGGENIGKPSYYNLPPDIGFTLFTPIKGRIDSLTVYIYQSETCTLRKSIVIFSLAEGALCLSTPKYKGKSCTGRVDVRYDFRMKIMFGSSLPPVVCRSTRVLYTLFVFACV
jgi:hypothetical protein